MRESFRVDVMDGLDELLRVVAHYALLEGTRVGDVIEKLTTWDKLAHDECYLHKLATLLFPGGVPVELVVLDNVTVLESLDRLDLVLQQLEGSLVELWIVQAEDLDGPLVALRVRGELHFGAEAGAECLS